MHRASMDERLKQRTASPIMPTPLASERELTTPRSNRLRRLLQILLILMLLIAGTLTSLFAYRHFAHHTPNTPTITASQMHIVTPPPEETTQITCQALPSLPPPEPDNTASFVVVHGKSYIY